MKLADFPFGKGDDGHAGELQMFVEGGHIGLVARNAVQRFGQHDVEFPGLRILQQGLDARSQDHAGAGDTGIFVGADDLPLLPPRLFPVNPELVLG
jgi:hypothetical protein